MSVLGGSIYRQEEMFKLDARRAPGPIAIAAAGVT